jgi:hypothetical protein
MKINDLRKAYPANQRLSPVAADVSRRILNTRILDDQAG